MTFKSLRRLKSLELWSVITIVSSTNHLVESAFSSDECRQDTCVIFCLDHKAQTTSIVLTKQPGIISKGEIGRRRVGKSVYIVCGGMFDNNKDGKNQIK